MSLLDKILKNSTIKETSLLKDSLFFKTKDFVKTPVPMINVALSGRIDGGLTCGVTMIAGPSKHFKTGFALLLAASYLKEHKDAVLIFYDSEFGTPQSYFDTFQIDSSRVIHTPVTDIEELKHDIVTHINNIEYSDKVIIVIDSIGNLASKKETDDAIDGKTVADMTRAKGLKSLFRIIGAKLTKNNIPLIVINHTYATLALYSSQVVGGGAGAVYNADNIWILGRKQEKDGDDLAGYNFVINVEKSRHVKEKSKIPITVNFKTGINKWSGLFDIALEMKFIAKSGNSYVLVDQETGELNDKKNKRDNIENDSKFWQNMFDTTNFASRIQNKYQLTNDQFILEEDTDSEG